MALRSHLTRRGSRYYFRQRIPTDLVDRLGCKEIRKSLLSSSPVEAVQRVLTVSWLCADFFQRVRAMADDEDVPKEVAIWKEGLMRMAYMHRVARIEGAKAQQDFDAYRRIHVLLTGEQRDEEVNRAHADGKEALAKQVLNVIGQTSTERPAVPAPSVSEFMAAFVEERGGQWDQSAHRHNINYLELFLKIVGDRPLNTYGREDIRKYVRTLEWIHNSYGKSSKDKSKDIDAILRHSEGKDTMTITTLMKHVRCVKSLFTVANRYLDCEVKVEKLFGDIRFRDDVPKAKKRKPWSIDDLNRLFATPIWRGTRAQKASLRYEKGRRIIKDAYWWLPVVAVFTGMRLEEIAQLQHGDLKHEGGIAYIDVVEGEGKRLKTESSIRAVPVHPKLLDLGFTALFKGGAPDDRIFPELPADGPDQKFGYQYSQDFTVYRRQTGLYEELRDFHSFRHTFATHLRRAIKDILMTGEIVGHETKQIETANYTHPTVADRYEAISELDYESEGLKIGHLLS